MLTLIIDTSTEKSFVAFAEESRVLLNIFLPPGHQSSKHLMPSIQSGFEQLNLSPQQLEAIAVGVGPGSFTGTRVGVAAAKGLAFPKALPLVGFCSLEAFISPEEGDFVSYIDAKSFGAYLLLQTRENGKIRRLCEPQFVSQVRFKEYLDLYKTWVSPENSSPDPEHVAHLCSELTFQKKYNKDLGLIYLHTPEYQ